eukprot:TRINITY_DN18355_c0_g1_i1.p1 TRINITY_DN18355_c0_g1~~TRINITY_DN18355_c0_g1_i1.p1  ORF type:complete len:449 (+),score=40.59 TRINITY_DN18355_c0_g1_i1:150-1349(+)
MQAGLWGGVIGLIVMALVTMYLNYIILSAKFKYKSETYHELCFEVLGPLAGWSMFTSVFITNVGSCSVYLVTGASLLIKVSDKLNIQEYILIIAIIELLICYLPDFKFLGWTSILGLIGLIIAMVCVFVYGFTEVGIQPLSSYPAINYETYGIFFSTAAFLYIQPSTFFPIANSATHPHKFNFYNTIAYIIIAITNTIFATISYMFFGNNTEDLVLLNICPGVSCVNTYTIIAQIALFVDVLFTFPLVLAPAHEVIEKAIFVTQEERETFTSSTIQLKRSESSSNFRFNSAKCFYVIDYSLFRRNILRTLTMVLTYAIAALIPNISGLVGIVSGATLTYNSFIMGAIIHLKCEYNYADAMEVRSFRWYMKLTIHIFIILCGIFLGVWAVYLAIIQIMNP